jgi:hypothetical protein
VEERLRQAIEDMKLKVASERLAKIEESEKELRTIKEDSSLQSPIESKTSTSTSATPRSKSSTSLTMDMDKLAAEKEEKEDKMPTEPIAAEQPQQFSDSVPKVSSIPTEITSLKEEKTQQSPLALAAKIDEIEPLKESKSTKKIKLNNSKEKRNPFMEANKEKTSHSTK